MDSSGKVTNDSIPPAVAPARREANGFSLALPLDAVVLDMVHLRALKVGKAKKERRDKVKFTIDESLDFGGGRA